MRGPHPKRISTTVRVGGHSQYPPENVPLIEKGVVLIRRGGWPAFPSLEKIPHALEQSELRVGLRVSVAVSSVMIRSRKKGLSNLAEQQQDKEEGRTKASYSWRMLHLVGVVGYIMNTTKKCVCKNRRKSQTLVKVSTITRRVWADAAHGRTGRPLSQTHLYHTNPRLSLHTTITHTQFF